MEEEQHECQDEQGETGERTGGGSCPGTGDGGDNKKTEVETNIEVSAGEKISNNAGSQRDDNVIEKNAKNDGSANNGGGGGTSSIGQSSPGDQNEKNDDDAGNRDDSVKNQSEEEAGEFVCEDGEKQASSSSISLIDEIRRSNWEGCIPVIVELAPTSNSSASKPPPIHVLLNRHTFLHVGLEDAVRKLHNYAPPTFTGGGGGGLGGASKRVVVVEEPESTLDLDMDMENGGRNTSRDDEKNSNSNDEDNDESSDTDTTTGSHKKTKKKKQMSPYPKCWFEDQETGTPLRWQYFVGVLFDSIVQPSSFQERGNAITTTPILPWKIRLHFISYPTTLLELDEGGGTTNYTGRNDNGSADNHDLLLMTIERTFFNSLKQSLVLQHGHAKVALNMTKQSHISIWEAVCTSSYDKYRPVGNDIQVKHPVNIIASSQKRKKNPPLSSSPAETTATTPLTTDNSSSSRDQGTSTETMPMPTPKSASAMKSMTIPVRLSVDPTQPMIQKRCDFDPNNTNENQNQRNPTLGSLLIDWAPQYFVRRNEHKISSSSQQNNVDICQDDNIGDDDEARVGEVVHARDSMSVTWRVAGVTPPLSTPLIYLWTTLSHPDQFLYISVVKRSATNRY